MDQLEHYGVKGMKWGVRRAGKAYMSATRKHEAKTKARREKVKNIKAAEKAHAKEVWSKAGKSYMDASRKHEAKTKARRERQSENLRNNKAAEKAHAKEVWSKAGKSYMNAARKHEAKTQARVQKRKEARAEKKWEKDTRKNLDSKVKEANIKSIDSQIKEMNRFNKALSKSPNRYITDSEYQREMNYIVSNAINKELSKNPSNTSPSKKKAVRTVLEENGFRAKIVDISKD